MDTLLKQSQSTEINLWLQPYEKLNGISMMDHLYNRLDGIYPHKFSSFFTDLDAINNWKNAWAEAFEEECITPQEVRNGLQYCLRNYDWPPSLPEFLKACRPFLERETAFYIARKGIEERHAGLLDRKSTRLNSSHVAISYAVCCLKTKTTRGAADN